MLDLLHLMLQLNYLYLHCRHHLNSSRLSSLHLSRPQPTRWQNIRYVVIKLDLLNNILFDCIILFISFLLDLLEDDWLWCGMLQLYSWQLFVTLKGKAIVLSLYDYYLWITADFTVEWFVFFLELYLTISYWLLWETLLVLSFNIQEWKDRAEELYKVD